MEWPRETAQIWETSRIKDRAFSSSQATVTIGLQPLADYYAAHGITSYLATTMTLKEETLTPAMHAIRDFKPAKGAKCAGVSSTLASASKAAPIIPGARWRKEGMPL